MYLSSRLARGGVSLPPRKHTGTYKIWPSSPPWGQSPHWAFEKTIALIFSTFGHKIRSYEEKDTIKLPLISLLFQCLPTDYWRPTACLRPLFIFLILIPITGKYGMVPQSESSITVSAVRAIPFDIFRGAALGKISDAPPHTHTFYFFLGRPPYIFRARPPTHFYFLSPVRPPEDLKWNSPYVLY